MVLYDIAVASKVHNVKECLLLVCGAIGPRVPRNDEASVAAVRGLFEAHFHSVVWLRGQCKCDRDVAIMAGGITNRTAWKDAATCSIADE